MAAPGAGVVGVGAPGVVGAAAGAPGVAPGPGVELLLPAGMVIIGSAPAPAAPITLEPAAPEIVAGGATLGVICGCGPLPAQLATEQHNANKQPRVTRSDQRDVMATSLLTVRAAHWGTHDTPGLKHRLLEPALR